MLSADDKLRNRVIMDLMCNLAVDVPAIEADHGIDFATTFGPALARLAPMVDDGLLTIATDRIEVTNRGRLLVRNAAMAFDAWLPKPGASDKPLFSRTV